VEKLMGETADAIAYQREVSEMLGGVMSAQDEDEVEMELAALEAEAAGRTAVQQPLPNVPDTELPPHQAVQVGEHSQQPEREAMLA